MRVFIAFLTIIFLNIACCTVARAQCDFPKNTLMIPENVEASGITKAVFDQAIAKAQSYYDPIFASYGARLVIINSWSDATVNAQAWREGMDWNVEMFGGLARYSKTNASAFLTVLCHEIGHHLGGLPTYNRNSDWASVEGQADYYAMDCMKQLKPGSALSGAIFTARMLASLGGEAMPKLNTPDQNVVARTYEGHPKAQCRLDTMYNRFRGQDRPRCWYAP